MWCNGFRIAYDLGCAFVVVTVLNLFEHEKNEKHKLLRVILGLRVIYF